MVQNRDKEGTISLILNSLSSASHYILFSWSIYRCENISISKDLQKNRGKWRHVKSRGKDRCSEPVIIQNPIGGLHNSETISLVSTGLYGSYGFVVTMVGSRMVTRSNIPAVCPWSICIEWNFQSCKALFTIFRISAYEYIPAVILETDIHDPYTLRVPMFT